MTQSNTPHVDLAAALQPEVLKPWVDFQYAQHASRTQALMAAFNRFLDATATGIQDDATAGRATDFVKQIKSESRATDETRTAIKAPVLSAQRLIDGEAKGLTDQLGSASREVEARLASYLRAKAAEAARIAAEEAARLQAEADAAIEAAQHVQTQDAANVAIEAIHQAQLAEQQAAAPMTEITRTRSAYGSLTGLKDNWTFRVVDIQKVPAAYLTVNEAVVKAAIKSGARDIAGLEIFNDAKVYVR
jgi:membrane protein involved in colicin uptake